jgi:hypothetical protein
MGPQMVGSAQLAAVQLLTFFGRRAKITDDVKKPSTT